MTGTVGSVVMASAQSVGKVYVIGAVGFLAVSFPKKAPLLPSHTVGTVARFGFNCLVLPLIYGTIAQSVNVDSIGQYWFLVVAAFFVIGGSYGCATVLGYLFRLHKEDPIDFDALRISAAFPNIVALPILIFPSLCEYSVVYKGFIDNDDLTEAEMYRECVNQSNTMIFCYFFMWSFLFWSLGHEKLMVAADKRVKQASSRSIEDNDHERYETARKSCCELLWVAITHTIKSPGFIAMILGFITACIPPLQDALFSPGGPLRFLGAAVQTLGQASSPMSTLVVAASLVPKHRITNEPSNDHGIETSADPEGQGPEEEPQETASSTEINNTARCSEESHPEDHHDPPFMSDPSFGPLNRRHVSMRRLSLALRERSSRAITSIRRSNKQMLRLHVWFVLSRLIVAPTLLSASMIGLECAGVLDGVPGLAKLVVIINSALPGALIVVVLLKSNPELSESAAVVAKIYLPSYLLSIVTIAAWASLGLWISLPKDDGTSFCSA